MKLLDGRRNEAVDLFREAVSRFDDATTLMSIADGARQLALDEVALAAARKAGTLGLNERVRAALFEADLARQRAKPDQAIALLKKTAAEAKRQPEMLRFIADALERYGDKAEALRLYQSIYEQTAAEDALLLVAWLLENNGRLDEACDLWRKTWNDTQVPARQKQAQERLLDLASRTGKLADLVVDLEENIDAGRNVDRSLSLLVEIYTTAKDPVSAAEMLHEFARRSGNRVDALRRLARVYLACENFGRCQVVLRQLVELESIRTAAEVQAVVTHRNRALPAQD